ncbi:hypothetical protein BJ508DRAFT_335498 [Ascobolus immersus RN42]|uniref:F-box domain-containing protein n=1 Tax=Ascobolus immersus RN42 TaxID=1160509 RepID=A0A3N4HC71_ASCIM|nr:hypothetical protein BJ508DRAFT_335498 [Ascobolus immersus RN42]
MTTPFDSLPKELLFEIARHLQWSDFNAFRQIDRTNYHFLTTEGVLESIFPLERRPAKRAITSVVFKILQLDPILPSGHLGIDPFREVLEQLLSYANIKFSTRKYRDKWNFTELIWSRHRYEVCRQLGSEATVFDIPADLWATAHDARNGVQAANQLRKALMNNNGGWTFIAGTDLHDVRDMKLHYNLRELGKRYLRFAFAKREKGKRLDFIGSPIWKAVREVLGRRLDDALEYSNEFPSDLHDFQYLLQELKKELGLLNAMWELARDIYNITNGRKKFTKIYADGNSDGETFPYKRAGYVTQLGWHQLHTRDDAWEENGESDGAAGFYSQGTNFGSVALPASI